MFPILDIQGLVKAYPGSDASFRLSVDTLQIGPGQIWGVTGPSGCGKSTLLENIALLSRPDAVSRFLLHEAPGVTVDIAALWKKDDREGLAALRRKHFGFVHQAGNLYPFLSVRENILMPYRLRFGPGGEKRMLELADMLGIGPLLNHKPGRLSYGERQRAAIARALVHSPRLVLADEPTSALDPETARRVMALFKECVRHTDTALLLVSHDLALLEDSDIPTLEVRRSETVETEGGACACWMLAPAPGASFHDARVPSAPKSHGEKERVPVSAAPARERSTFPGAGLLCLHMAWKDFLHEGLLSFCGILAFAAALTPVLLLAGLRFGIVDTLSQRLLNAPGTLEITPYGSMRLTREKLEALAAHPCVDFLVARTRTLAAGVSLEGAGKKRLTVDLVPTAEGDPLLLHAGLAFPDHGVIITRELERSLPSVDGARSLELFITRMNGGRMERVSVTFPVTGVLPDAADWKAHIYTPLSFTEAVESYRDGFSVPEYGWPGRDGRPERTYAGFRMYVNTLDDVVAMHDILMAEGMEVYTAAREVKNVQDLRRALFFATVLIGGVTVAGMALSLASFAVSGVGRKEALFAQAGLMGFPSWAMLLFPAGRMTLLALCAASVSLLLYGGAAVLFDLACAPHLLPGESVCRIPFSYVLLAYAGAACLSLLCCTGAGKKLLRLQPAEVLRRHV